MEEKEIKLTVDYCQSLQQMIVSGNYGWTNSDITENNFPLPTEFLDKKITVSTKLFHFNRDISSEDVIFEMEKVGYRPATLPELLALGKTYPELQKDFRIVALGSIWDAYGLRGVPILDSGRERWLNLGWFGNGWVNRHRFFGICKTS